MNELELTVLDWIQAHLVSPFGDAVMPAVSFLADGGVIWIALAVILLAVKKTRPLGAAVAAALVLELIGCNLAVKPLAARIRPYDLNPDARLLIPALHDYSFPSGHTGASFAAASALYFGKSRLYIPAGVLAVLIGFSRLYLYVHYPTDVLAGMVLGILFGYLGQRLVDRFYEPTVRRIFGK